MSLSSPVNRGLDLSVASTVADVIQEGQFLLSHMTTVLEGLKLRESALSMHLTYSQPQAKNLGQMPQTASARVRISTQDSFIWHITCF